MLEHMGWDEAANLITKGIEGAIQSKVVTYDFHRLMDNAKKVSHKIPENLLGIGVRI